MNALFALQTTQRSIGYVVLAVIVIGGVFFVITQMRHGRKEAGAELELAPNRKPYLADEELEGPKLNLALWAALGLLIVIALSLPLYWLGENGRENGAVAYYRQQVFVPAGATLFGDDPLNGAKCQDCHGPNGVGGQTSYVITDANGKYVQTVTWNAPALNTVLWRFSQTEVLDILTYGRPGTPMQPWGVTGGGALSQQQLQDLVDYLWSIQLPLKTIQSNVLDAIKEHDPLLEAKLVAVQKKNGELTDPLSYECDDGKFACLDTHDQLELGEILFNLNSVASGAYSCARCHVPGFSFGEPWESIDVTARGRYAPNLVGIEHDLTEQQQFALVMQGSTYGKIYGGNHIGSGRMPAFGLNPNFGDTTITPGDSGIPQLGKDGMFTPEMVWAIMMYERNLDVERSQIDAQHPGDDSSSSIQGIASTEPTTTTVPASSGSSS